MTTHVRHTLEVIERSYADHITLDTLSTTLDRQAAYLGYLFRKKSE